MLPTSILGVKPSLGFPGGCCRYQACGARSPWQRPPKAGALSSCRPHCEAANCTICPSGRLGSSVSSTPAPPSWQQQTRSSLSGIQKKTTIENIQLPHTLLSRYDSTCSSNRWFYFTHLWKVQGEGEKEITRINTANRHLFMAVCSACLLSHGS